MYGALKFSPSPVSPSYSPIHFNVQISCHDETMDHPEGNVEVQQQPEPGRPGNHEQESGGALALQGGAVHMLVLVCRVEMLQGRNLHGLKCD